MIKITCSLNCIHNQDGICELEDSTPLASFYEVECPFYEENLGATPQLGGQTKNEI
ncbi:MAG: hypothetical protein M1299_03105 [Firmicutes bacterium]|nr:hypothetical protein [Bacillota bacterium]MCL5038805.1 hypothetical protein [Bacillota bacterium]